MQFYILNLTIICFVYMYQALYTHFQKIFYPCSFFSNITSYLFLNLFFCIQSEQLHCYNGVPLFMSFNYKLFCNVAVRSAPITTIAELQAFVFTNKLTKTFLELPVSSGFASSRNRATLLIFFKTLQNSQPYRF
jgi:hypothetical protein